MPHPLFSLAERLERHAEARARRRAMERAQADPHLARDVGLPYRPAPKVRIDRW